jgi:hypothetical protein
MTEEVEALTDVDHPGFLWRQAQPQGGEHGRHLLPQRLGVVPVARYHQDKESRRGESHPPPLAEPCGSLSAYTAPIVQPSGLRPKRQ